MHNRQNYVVFAVLGIFLLSGCSASAVRVPAIYQTTKFVRNATNWEPARNLNTTLRSENIVGLERLNPRLVDDLAARFDQEPTPARALALAELSLQRGKRGLPGIRSTALNQLRNAAVYASFAASAPENVERAAAVHNEALDTIFQAIRSDRRSEPGTWQHHLAELNVEVLADSSILAPERIEQIDPAANYQIQAFYNRYQRPGLGVPVVARWRNQEGRFHPELPAYLGKNVIAGATAVLSPTAPALGGAWRNAPVTLRLHDTQDARTVNWAGQPVNLAFDNTTDIAVFASQDRLLTATAAVGVLQSALPEFDPGIYMKEPYKPGKIPVLLVHGLNSSPATWLKDLNELKNDPELSQHYQFWAFFYPTGQPIPVSAHRLRAAIEKARQDLDPLHEDPAFDKMVVIGHSLGGILSRMMTLESGDTVWNAVLDVPESQLEASPGTQEYLRTALLFHPVPCVARTIYIAAPHRGSPVAVGPVGRLTTRLSRPDPQLTDIRDELSARYGPDIIKGRTFRSGYVIENLRPDSESLRAIANLPSNPNVPVHSIILQRLWRDTDGLVSYESAHVDGAESELLTRSTHVKHETQEVIQELRRILSEHLAVNQSQTAFTTAYPEQGMYAAPVNDLAGTFGALPPPLP